MVKMGDDMKLRKKLEEEQKREDAEWHYFYEQLVAFKKKYGHCNVPVDYVGDDSDCKEVN